MPDFPKEASFIDITTVLQDASLHQSMEIKTGGRADFDMIVGPESRALWLAPLAYAMGKALHR